MSRLWRLTRKELYESLRDRRTILTLVLMPLLLYPILAVLFQQIALGGGGGGKADPSRLAECRVGFPSKRQAEEVSEVWRRGRAWRASRSKADRDTGAPAHLQPLARLTLHAPFTEIEAEEALRTGNLDLFMQFSPGKGQKAVVLAYLDGNALGQQMAREMEWIVSEYNLSVLDEERGGAAGSRPVEKLRPTVVTLAAPAGARPALVPVLVPLILILMTMTGAVYPAIDLTAGERERGTMEILAAAPIPRLSVLLAKYIAVLTVAMLTALANLGSMAVTLSVTGLGQALFGGSFGLSALIKTLMLLILFASFFSAILLALTSFARSFKEAQAYLIPLMLVCLTPGVMALLPGLSLAGPLAVVPLLNIVLLARDVLEGTATAPIALSVVLITLVYALAAVSLAARVFATEAVVSSESSGWSDLLRRPAEPSKRASASTALMCLALMFPLTLLVTAGLSRLPGSVSMKLGLVGAASAGLIAGIPLLAAMLGGVRIRDGFRLSWPGWSCWLAATLIGLGAWPIVHEVSFITRSLGLQSLPSELLARLEEVQGSWREAPVWFVVAMMAVLPAVSEELLYRGYLWSSLSNWGPWGRVWATSLLFAAFHLLVGQLIAVERFVPSLLLGLALGALAWRSGSVLPGMLLHALHNTSLLLIAYYKDAVVASGWVPEADGHLGVGVLGAGLALALAGLAALTLGSPGQQKEDGKGGAALGASDSAS
jgi:ABC-2 type transport system permease protein/sodium transport system permease protein